MDNAPRPNLWIAWMETLDGLGYITAGFSFLAVGMVVFAHAWYVFVTTFASGVLPAVLSLIHDLLLVIILLELFRTIINFLKTHVITLEPSCISASLPPLGAYLLPEPRLPMQSI